MKKKTKNKNNLRNRENHPKIGAGVFGDEHARMRKSSRKWTNASEEKKNEIDQRDLINDLKEEE